MIPLKPIKSFSNREEAKKYIKEFNDKELYIMRDEEMYYVCEETDFNSVKGNNKIYISSGVCSCAAKFIFNKVNRFIKNLYFCEYRQKYYKVKNNKLIEVFKLDTIGNYWILFSIIEIILCFLTPTSIHFFLVALFAIVSFTGCYFIFKRIEKTRCL